MAGPTRSLPVRLALVGALLLVMALLFLIAMRALLTGGGCWACG